jgi:hypothetical protein
MDHYSFEELNILTRYHLNYYRAYLKKEAFSQEYGICVSESLRHVPLEKAYAYSIRCSLERLSEDERRILTKELIETEAPNWWMEYFSKSTYYRIKHRAYTRFIHCLHHEIVV